ncbi:ComF family protein [Patescibacteria group bacterium]|nr:ComF family protein [Patescibacteria group bacterium]
MLKTLKNRSLQLWSYMLDILIPPRNDFEIVSKMDMASIQMLPKAPDVSGLDWIHPLFHYKDNKVRAIIWELKYKEVTKVLDYIGLLIYEEIIPIISDVVLFNNDAEFLLIPIPITHERRVERGFNQSEYIAKAVHTEDIGHVMTYAPQWLEKIEDTPKQSRSDSREERMNNLHGSFYADPRVEGKYIILIDDVVTTGSTLSEARLALLESGAKDVFAYTIAH